MITYVGEKMPLPNSWSTESWQYKHYVWSEGKTTI